MNVKQSNDALHCRLMSRVESFRLLIVVGVFGVDDVVEEDDGD